MIEIRLPAMGEGIIEAEITRWFVREGTRVKSDDPLVEVATDKVDNEIPCPGNGVIHKIMLHEGDTAKVGQVLAVIDDLEDRTESDDLVPPGETHPSGETGSPSSSQGTGAASGVESGVTSPGISAEETGLPKPAGSGTGVPASPTEPGTYPGAANHTFKKSAFLSPVLKKIARENEVSPLEIEQLEGSGLGGRITKADLMSYLSRRRDAASSGLRAEEQEKTGVPQADQRPLNREKTGPSAPTLINPDQIYGSGTAWIEEMDRMRKIIADHMVYSKQTAPHVTSFVEADVSGMFLWRERVKDDFLKKFGQKLTLTTLILEAAIIALKEYPRINVSIDRDRIIHKKDLNIGLATALPDGNLIVPVIHQADRYNLGGLAGRVNDLAERARKNRLKPTEIQGGTFTVTNLGQFGNIAGTPIINQPQSAILAVGAVLKKPAVVRTARGEGIGIRHLLVLSLAYDHRVIDGALGGSFLQRIGYYLQAFDTSRLI